MRGISNGSMGGVSLQLGKVGSYRAMTAAVIVVSWALKKVRKNPLLKMKDVTPFNKDLWIKQLYGKGVSHLLGFLGTKKGEACKSL